MNKKKNYGGRGAKEREEFESGFENFKVGALILDTHLKFGMTQEQFAEKAGMTK